LLAFDGIRVLDFSRQAPGPFCTMVLGDFGADVIAVEPPAGTSDRPEKTTAAARRQRLHNATWRGKRSIVLDLKQEPAREVARRLAADADVVVEGFRPGVADRLGIGWDELHGLNPRLVYCSISGYGQDGPDRLRAGHDINYISKAGALSQIARSPDDPPMPPMNVLADYAGGGLMAAYSIATALFVRERFGEGQRIDLAMTDGVQYLMADILTPFFATGRDLKAGTQFFNDGWPAYNVYRTKDGRFVSVGSLEPHFWRNLCEKLRLPEYTDHEFDTARHPEIVERFRKVFATKTARQWVRLFGDEDLCAELILTPAEALRSERAAVRGMFLETELAGGKKARTIGIGPKLLGTPGRPGSAPTLEGAATRAILEDAGYGVDDIEALLATGAARED